MTEHIDVPSPDEVPGFGRRSFLVGSAGLVAATSLVHGGPTAVAAQPPTAGGEAALGAPARGRHDAAARRATRIGIGYETWFDAVGWGRSEAEPVLGHYSSTDAKVIEQHARWLTYAGFDHLLLDWSNNLGANWGNGTADNIIAGTDKLIEVYRGSKVKDLPQVTLLIGTDNGSVTTDDFNAQIAMIKTKYLNDPQLRDMFVVHDGHPLLTIYTGARATPPPSWSDPAFTVRWMGAFREIVLNPGGQWSWEDRLPYANGPETPIADFTTDKLAGWTAVGEWHVDTITTHQALRLDVSTIAATSKPASGDQKVGTLTSPPFPITQPVVSFNAIGFDPSSGADISRLDGRNVFLLRDAVTHEVLRSATPPGDEDRFYVRQWNVTDLIGRKVVFRAVNNATAAGLTGWMGLTNPVQQRAEQMTAVVANAGNEAPGAYVNWDAHPRNSGAYLVQMMANAFRYEPEFLLIQQWNEFGRPDQYSVEASNDIEPTKVTRLAGAESDGWGYCYLKLVRDLVDQYRAGRPFPAVTLDTRYP